MNLNKYIAIFAVVAATMSGTAKADSRDVVRDINNNVIKNTFDNCVRTKWDSTGQDACGAPVAEEPRPVAQAEPAKKAIIRSRSYLVFFDFDKATLTESALEIIQKANAEAEKNTGAVSFSLTGHADRSGSDAYNLKLSKRRVDAVTQELVKLGSDRQQIETNAKGESEPLVPTPDGVKEPQNRRVEIIYNVGE